jgi:Amt family ammonium transporter
MVAEWVHRGKPTVLGIASGIISGLATITPAAGFVGPISAMIIGLVAGTLCYAAVVCKMKLGYDDSLDVVGIHGVGGFIGIVAVGLFASIGATGLFFGNAGLLGIQVFLALVTLAFSAAGTYIILKIVDWTVGLRITAQDEEMGLDLSQHNERAYS